MSHYTDGFSKDMIKAFNASKYKVGTFNNWCAEHPGRLTEQQILKVKIALRRARSSNSAYTHRKRQSLRDTMLATDIIQLDRKNKQLHKELNNLRQKYNTLLEQVREFVKTHPLNNQINNDELPATLNSNLSPTGYRFSETTSPEGQTPPLAVTTVSVLDSFPFTSNAEPTVVIGDSMDMYVLPFLFDDTFI